MPPRKPKWKPSFVVAVDPGESAGFAVVVDGKVAVSGPAIGSRFVSLHASLRDAVSPLGLSFDQALGVIEQGWSSGFKGQMTLSQRRGLAQAAMESIGVREFKYLPSSTWMNGWYGSIHGKDTKQLSYERATLETGARPINDDVADAINMGLYSYREFCK